jgi:thiol-disulfide isomerase/thioredoxin
MNWKYHVSLAAITILGAIALVMTRPSAHPVHSSSMMTEVTPDQVFQKIKELNARVVLVNFWASWCEPCKKEFPQLLKLRETWKERGLRVMFISIDEPSDQPAAEEFLHQQNVGFETYSKGAQSLSFVSKLFPKWEGAVPTTLLFNSQSQLLDAWEGDASLKEFEEHIQRQLEGP